MRNVPGKHSAPKVKRPKTTGSRKRFHANKEKQGEQSDFDREDESLELPFLANKETGDRAAAKAELPDLLKFSDLREKLEASNTKDLKRYLGEFVKPWLISGVKAGASHLHVALAGEYAFIEACRPLSEKRQKEILNLIGAGGNYSTKEDGWFQSRVVRVLHPLPPHNLVKPRDRKNAQNVNYTYGLAFDGARQHGVAPDEFARALEDYGVQGLADYGRSQLQSRKKEKVRAAKIEAGANPAELDEEGDAASAATRPRPAKRRARGVGPVAHGGRVIGRPQTIKVSAPAGLRQVKVEEEVAAIFNARGRKVCVVDVGAGAPVVRQCWAAEGAEPELKKLRRAVYRSLIADLNKPAEDNGAAEASDDEDWGNDR